MPKYENKVFELKQPSIGGVKKKTKNKEYP